MAIFGYPDLKIELDDSGGTLRDISAYVTDNYIISKKEVVPFFYSEICIK